MFPPASILVPFTPSLNCAYPERPFADSLTLMVFVPGIRSIVPDTLVYLSRR
ncbi:MAG: hypothetical protein FWE20_12020 [Defluviitaleaceae bacterium]|nr:hypothetical protein [Defluviitaleaceae bacterium]